MFFFQLLTVVAVIFWIVLIFQFITIQIPSYIDESMVELLGLGFFQLMEIYKYVALALFVFGIYLTCASSSRQGLINRVKEYIKLQFVLQSFVLLAITCLLISVFFAHYSNELASDMRYDIRRVGPMIAVIIYSLISFFLHAGALIIGFNFLGGLADQLEFIISKRRAYWIYSGVGIFIGLTSSLILQNKAHWLNELVGTMPIYKVFVLAILTLSVLAFAIAIIVNSIDNSPQYFNRLSVYPLAMIGLIILVILQLLFFTAVIPFVEKAFYTLRYAIEQGYYIRTFFVFIAFYLPALGVFSAFAYFLFSPLIDLVKKKKSF